LGPSGSVRGTASNGRPYATLHFEAFVSGLPVKELAIDKDGEGFVEIRYTRIYRICLRWVANGCIDAIFAGSVLRLHRDGLLDTTVIHGGGEKGRQQPRL
jgi:hypothetical protein